MDFADHPLLNDPSLVALILHAAAEGPVGPDGLIRRLLAILATAHEAPGVPEVELGRHLDALCDDLARAGLLAAAADETFALTDSGTRALAEHPLGLDRADLTRWPGYADDLFRRSNGPGTHPPRIAPGDGPHPEVYNQGAAAHAAGLPPSDNPHPYDTADHLAWENGWYESEAG